MVTYPVHVRRNGYRGSDASKRAKANSENRDASVLEDYANKLLLAQTRPIQVYFWMELAQGTGLPYETVARLGASIDGGSGGFTAWRHDMTSEAAMAANSQARTASDKSGDD